MLQCGQMSVLIAAIFFCCSRYFSRVNSSLVSSIKLTVAAFLLKISFTEFSKRVTALMWRVRERLSSSVIFFQIVPRSRGTKMLNEEPYWNGFIFSKLNFA